MTIPWIVYGPASRPGATIEADVRIDDTAPTLARIMNLPLPPQWDGKVITEALA